MVRVTAVFCLLFAFGISADPAPTIAQRCAEAQAMILATEVADAKDAYGDLAREGATAPCVVALRQSFIALRAEAQPFFAKGKALEAKKELKRAREQYVEALKRDSSFTQAAAALVRLSTPTTESPFAEARRLSRLGLHQDALVAFKAAAKTTDDDPPPDLQYLSGGEFGPWRTFIRTIERWPVKEMGAVVICLLAAIVLLVVRVVSGPRVDIVEFNDDNATPKVGRSMTALLRDRTQYFAANLLPRYGFVDGSAQAFAIPATITASVPGSLSWINWIPALLGAIHLQRVLRVQGTLHPAGDDGAGVTITLRDGNRVLFTSTMWQRDFDPAMPPPREKDPSGYHELAEPAAIWLLFRLSEV